MKKLPILFSFILIYFQTSAQTLIPYLKINGKIIYVDSATMKPVIEKEFDDAFVFTDGFAGVELNGKYGFIDKKGSSLTDFKYEEANNFKNGIARVYVDKKASFIDTSGKEIFPFKYNGLGEFIDGFAFAMQDEKWGYIDRTGKEIVPVKYDWILEFAEGMAKVELNGKYGFVNKTGVEVIPIKYDNALDFSMGLAAVGVNGKYGFIDKKGKVVIPLKYHFTRVIQNGLLLVTVDSGSAGYRSGIIDKMGKVVIPLKYSNIAEFTKGIYLVRLGNKIQLISGASKKLAEWDNYESWRSISEGIVFLEIKKGLPDAGKWVMINNQGKEITPTRFEVGGEFKNGIAPVKTDGKWFFIDKTGKPLFESKYDNIYSFDKGGIARVSLNNRWFYIDKAGREFREKEKPLAAGWLFFDEFKDNRNGWGIDSTSKDFPTVFRTGGYDVWNKRDDQSRFLLRKIPGWNEKNNFRIEITMKYAFGTPENMGNGLIIGCDDKISNYYRIMYNPDGSYRIDQSVIGKIVPLQDWKESNQIIKNGYNKLGFTQINGQWAFYINDKKVYEMKAKEFFGKGTGIFIGPGSSYYWGSFNVYDWTLAARDPESPKEPLYVAQALDYFKNNRLEWGTADNQNVTANFTSNAYRIKNKTDGYYMSYLLFAEEDMKAHRVELDLRHIDGVDDNAFGLCFGQKDIDNSWLFIISANGHFQLGKFENGKWTATNDWTGSDAIVKGSLYTNRLRYENDKGKWKFYINDKLVYTRTASVLAGKHFGCYVESKQTVEFTRFKFSRILYP